MRPFTTALLLMTITIISFALFKVLGPVVIPFYLVAALFLDFIGG